MGASLYLLSGWRRTVAWMPELRLVESVVRCKCCWRELRPAAAMLSRLGDWFCLDTESCSAELLAWDGRWDMHPAYVAA